MQSYHSAARVSTFVTGRKYQKTLFGVMAATGAVGLSYSILNTDKVMPFAWELYSMAQRLIKRIYLVDHGSLWRSRWW